MSSSSLTPHYTGSTTKTFTLVGESATGAKWLVSGRPLANPESVELIRKIGTNGNQANDHIILRLIKAETNSTTNKVATAVTTLDISIPRDTVTVTATMVNDMLGSLVSLLNELADTTATASRAKIISLLSGGSL